MLLPFTAVRFGLARKTQNNTEHDQKDSSRPTRPFGSLLPSGWFSKSSTSSSSSKAKGRPSTPTPRSLLDNSSASRAAKSKHSSKRSSSSRPSSSSSSDEPLEASEYVNVRVDADSDACPDDQISDEERARLNSFARGLKEMMDVLRRAEEVADLDLPPTKTADGTPLPPIEEEDEPLSALNSPVASPTSRFLHTMPHSNIHSHVNVDDDDDDALTPLQYDCKQSRVSTDADVAQLEDKVHEDRDEVEREDEDNDDDEYEHNENERESLPCRPTTPEPFALSTLEGALDGPEDIENAIEEEVRAEDEDVRVAEQGEDENAENADTFVSFATFDDSDTSSTTNSDSVLALLPLLPPSHDPSMPSTPTPTFGSSTASFLTAINTPSLTRSRPRGRLQILPAPATAPVQIPISLFARPLSTGTTMTATTSTTLDGGEVYICPGDSNDDDGDDAAVKEKSRSGAMLDLPVDEVDADGFDLGEDTQTHRTPEEQIADMQSKLGEIRKRLGEISEAGAHSQLEERELEEPVLKPARGDVDDLRATLASLTQTNHHLVAALAASERARAELHAHNALLLQVQLQTADMLRAQADEIRALREQVEGLQKTVGELVVSGDGGARGEGKSRRRPVDPIDPSLRRGRPRTAPGSLNASPASSLSSSSTSSSPSSFFVSASSSPCTGQLTTPPATPHRAVTALGDGPAGLDAFATIGSGSGTVTGLSVPADYRHAEVAAAAPARAGSWHGLVRKDGKRRKQRGTLPVLSLPGDEDDDNGEDGDILPGRSQIKRRAGSMDLKSISSFWRSHTRTTTNRI